jgi:signal transduction histidine kinase
MRRLLDAVLTIGADLELPSMLDRIVRAGRDLVDARYAALGVLDDSRTRLAQFITVGLDENERRRIGALPEGHGILGLLIVDAKPLRLADLREHPDSYGFPPGHPPMRSFLGVPIRTRDQVFGNLYLTDKTTADVFTEEDEELVVGLAAAAAVAIENARLHAQLAEMALLDDRERIARDLHDTVIQRLFAAGLTLKATTRLIEADPSAAIARVTQAVDDLDLTIRHIRTAIFGLEATRGSDDGLRQRVLAVAREVSRVLGFEPRVVFEGAVDTLVSEAIATEVVAVLREALSNVARHAAASSVDIEIAADVELTVTVIDDGVGLPPSGDERAGNGMLNMAARAERLGGTCTAERRSAQRGTSVVWRVPLKG